VGWKGASWYVEKVRDMELDCRGVFNKKSCDLSKLKKVSEASLKSLRMVLRLLDSCTVGEFMIMVSSTNWLWEEAGCSP
jgi:hypothetical protein